MSIRPVFVEGEFYHLYNRGIEKRRIFSNVRDYRRFLSLLYLANGTKPVRLDDVANVPQGETLRNVGLIERGDRLVDLAAYCLMPNHFHLLVREKGKGGISKFMQKLTTGYTMYFNKKYERNGALFQGAFKSEHAHDDRYLKYLVSYIHLNPVKLIEPTWKENGIKNLKSTESYLKKYPYSSYIDHAGAKRAENSIINLQALPLYFETPEQFCRSMSEWLHLRNESGNSAR